MASAVRLPAVAGRFYPERPDELLREIEEYTSPAQTKRIFAIGCIAPHAGYVYSGPVAGAVYSRLEVPQECIVLCPNHTGRGVPLAIMSRTTWRTPIGEAAPSEELADRLLLQYPALEEDSAAHRGEHAIEVQLPFLLAQRRDLRIVPIVVGTRDFRTLKELGEAIAAVIGERENERVLIVASSDMNHYESDAITRVKDRKAIDRVLELDARGLWEVVTRDDISMCGFGPTVAMLTAAKLLGATNATLVQYATSGDVSGNLDAVVGYAGIVVA